MKKEIPQLDFTINLDAIAEGLTQSEMQTWDNCPEKWYLQYNLLLHRIGKHSWPLTYGTWIHGMLEQFYLSRGKNWKLDTPIKGEKFIALEDLAQAEYWRGVAKVQSEMYVSHFKHDFKLWEPVVVEEIVDLEFQGIRLKGMIDGLFRDITKKKATHAIWDHKTAKRFDDKTMLGWDFRFQFMFYMWLATKSKKLKEFPCSDFVVNGIKKPSIEQGKQTLPQFLQRLQIDMMERPEFYYYRKRYTLTKDSLKHFEENILGPKLARIRMIQEPSIPDFVKQMFTRNKNTDHCINSYGGVCEFLPACQNGLAIEGFQYKKREAKHQELITEE